MDNEWLNISCMFYTFTKFDGISTHITNHNRCGMDLHVQTCCWPSKVVKNEERTKNLQSVNLKRNKKMCYLPLLCDWHILFHSLLLIQSTTYLTYVLYNCIKTTGTHCTNTTIYLLPLDTMQRTFMILRIRPMHNLLYLFSAYYSVYICVHNVECVHTVHNVYW